MAPLSEPSRLDSLSPARALGADDVQRFTLAPRTATAATAATGPGRPSLILATTATGPGRPGGFSDLDVDLALVSELGGLRVRSALAQVQTQKLSASIDEYRVRKEKELARRGRLALLDRCFSLSLHFAATSEISSLLRKCWAALHASAASAQQRRKGALREQRRETDSCVFRALEVWRLWALKAHHARKLELLLAEKDAARERYARIFGESLEKRSAEVACLRGRLLEAYRARRLALTREATVSAASAAVTTAAATATAARPWAARSLAANARLLLAFPAAEAAHFLCFAVWRSIVIVSGSMALATAEAATATPPLCSGREGARCAMDSILRLIERRLSSGGLWNRAHPILERLFFTAWHWAVRSQREALQRAQRWPLRTLTRAVFAAWHGELCSAAAATGRYGGCGAAAVSRRHMRPLLHQGLCLGIAGLLARLRWSPQGAEAIISKHCTGTFATSCLLRWHSFAAAKARARCGELAAQAQLHVAVVSVWAAWRLAVMSSLCTQRVEKEQQAAANECRAMLRQRCRDDFLGQDSNAENFRCTAIMVTEEQGLHVKASLQEHKFLLGIISSWRKAASGKVNKLCGLEAAQSRGRWAERVAAASARAMRRIAFGCWLQKVRALAWGTYTARRVLVARSVSLLQVCLIHWRARVVEESRASASDQLLRAERERLADSARNSVIVMVNAAVQSERLRQITGGLWAWRLEAALQRRQRAAERERAERLEDFQARRTALERVAQSREDFMLMSIVWHAWRQQHVLFDTQRLLQAKHDEQEKTFAKGRDCLAGAWLRAECRFLASRALQGFLIHTQSEVTQRRLSFEQRQQHGRFVERFGKVVKRVSMLGCLRAWRQECEERSIKKAGVALSLSLSFRGVPSKQKSAVARSCSWRWAEEHADRRCEVSLLLVCLGAWRTTFTESISKRRQKIMAAKCEHCLDVVEAVHSVSTEAMLIRISFGGWQQVCVGQLKEVALRCEHLEQLLAAERQQQEQVWGESGAAPKGEEHHDLRLQPTRHVMETRPVPGSSRSMVAGFTPLHLQDEEAALCQLQEQLYAELRLLDSVAHKSLPRSSPAVPISDAGSPICQFPDAFSNSVHMGSVQEEVEEKEEEESQPGGRVNGAELDTEPATGAHLAPVEGTAQGKEGSARFAAGEWAFQGPGPSLPPSPHMALAGNPIPSITSTSRTSSSSLSSTRDEGHGGHGIPFSELAPWGEPLPFPSAGEGGAENLGPLPGRGASRTNGGRCLGPAVARKDAAEAAEACRAAVEAAVHAASKVSTRNTERSTSSASTCGLVGLRVGSRLRGAQPSESQRSLAVGPRTGSWPALVEDAGAPGAPTISLLPQKGLCVKGFEENSSENVATGAGVTKVGSSSSEPQSSAPHPTLLFRGPGELDSSELNASRGVQNEAWDWADISVPLSGPNKLRDES